MTLADGVLSLHPRSKRKGWSNVITIFLCSLAKSGHPRIAITLSGLDGDGAPALKAFKESGGVTIVQAPETAEKADPPLAWMKTGLVNYVINPESLARRLVTVARAHAWVR